MAEEWGKIIIKANNEISQKFKEDFNTALMQLAVFSGIDTKLLESSAGSIDEVEINSGYIVLSYDCSDWVDVSELFVINGSNIEYYAKHGDEYGTLSFFALSSNGTRLAFQYDEEGDAMEDEGYQKEISTKLDHWMLLIPEEIKQYMS